MELIFPKMLIGLEQLEITAHALGPLSEGAVSEADWGSVVG